jgi:hypothetical protein
MVVLRGLQSQAVHGSPSPKCLELRFRRRIHYTLPPDPPKTGEWQNERRPEQGKGGTEAAAACQWWRQPEKVVQGTGRIKDKRVGRRRSPNMCREIDGSPPMETKNPEKSREFGVPAIRKRGPVRNGPSLQVRGAT